MRLLIFNLKGSHKYAEVRKYPEFRQINKLVPNYSKFQWPWFSFYSEWVRRQGTYWLWNGHRDISIAVSRALILCSGWPAFNSVRSQALGEEMHIWVEAVLWGQNSHSQLGSLSLPSRTFPPACLISGTAAGLRTLLGAPRARQHSLSVWHC